MNYTFDALNRMKTVSSTTGVTTYGYDRALEKHPLDGQSLALGLRDGLSSVGNRQGNSTSSERPPRSPIAHQVASPPDTFRGPVGNRAFVEYANGTQAHYQYDDLNRLTQLTNVDILDNPISQHTYTLGTAGNGLQMAETLPTGNRAVDYTYDDLYRLTEEQVTDPVHGNSTTSFTYDATGNRLTQTVDDGTVITTTYTYDANDRIQSETGTDTITWQYDANGNTVAKYINGSLDTTYDYNSQNRLIEADVQGQITNYTYDPSGIRQSSTTAGQSTNYLVDPNRAYAQVLEELDHLGNANVIYSYGDDLLSQTRAEGAFIYHYDGLGSTRALTDQTGTSTDSYIYTAFGELKEQQGTTPNTYLYTGEQLDPNLGFYYLRARYYNPSNGRFPSMDTWIGRSADPRTLHKYLYTHADPVNGVDPSGHVTLMQVGIALSITGTLASSGYGAYQVYNGDYSGAAWTFAEIVALNGVTFWGVKGYKNSVKFLSWWSKNRKVRQTYNKIVNQMQVEAAAMRAANKPLRAIAERMVKLRNEAKATTRATMDPRDVAKLEARNMRDYGDKLGPTLDDMIAKYRVRNPGATTDEILGMVVEGSRDTSFLYNLFFFAF